MMNVSRRMIFIGYFSLCFVAWTWAQTDSSDMMRSGAWDEYAFVEMSVPRGTCFVQETVTVSLRFGFDTDFFELHAIQLFQSRLDAPLQLQVSWWDQRAGAVLLDTKEESTEERTERMTFALNEGRAEARRLEDRVIDTRSFTVLEITRSFVPLEAGELVISEPVLRFAYASKFLDSLISGRVAADRSDVAVPGEPLTLTVQPLPEIGKPASFSGAVGCFTIRADAIPSDLKVGESFRLRLVIEGQGNSTLFAPPILERIEGFHFYGMIEDQSDADSRSLLYDLAPLSDAVQHVPPIEFAFFDPRPPARYRTIRTGPVLITVHPLPEGMDPAFPSDSDSRVLIPGQNDIFDILRAAEIKSGGSGQDLNGFALIGVLLLPWPLAMGLLILLRRREKIRNDPEGVRARGASESFHSKTEYPGSDLAQAFAEFLAARLRCPEAAVISPDLAARLEASRVPTEMARRAAELLDLLVAARYGGVLPEDLTRKARSLVDTLEEVFQSREEAS
ncbi:MAG: BatD family protein [Planctomycetota bacterium]